MQQSGVQLIPPVVDIPFSHEDLFGDLFKFIHTITAIGQR